MSRSKRPATPKQSYYDVVCTHKVVSRATYCVMAASAEEAARMVERDPSSGIVDFEADGVSVDVVSTRATPKRSIPKRPTKFM